MGVIVVSQNFVLTEPDSRFPVTADHPIVGWHNIVTADTIAADTEDANHPASDLANPATYLYWLAEDTSEQYLTLTIDFVDDLDYLAVAGHNFGSAAIPVSVEGFISGVWTEIVEEHMLADDSPVIFRFTAQSLSAIRLRMQSGDDPPRAAVLYVGRLLILERRIYADHVPMSYARKNEIVSGMSESGNFLGRNVLGAWRETTIPIRLMSPAFYREFVDDFVQAAITAPFFFGWRPETYPLEAGFGWLTDDPEPMPQDPGNLIGFELKVKGVA